MNQPLSTRLLTPLALIALLLMAAVGQAQPYGPEDEPATTEVDPYESWNRKVFGFNEFVDSWFLRPVAQGYRTVMPNFADRAVTNFFNNLSEIKNLVNSIFQLKGESAVVAVGRFTYNTTFGLGGLIDVATAFDLPERPEDFGQTLGYWGVGSGPYLMMPLLGPSNPRDFTGLMTDIFVLPSPWDSVDSPENYYARGVQLVDIRADLIPAESFLSGDKYNFVRNAYLQRREFLINDGRQVVDPFAQDGEDLMLEDF
ncbi:MlaA family lipoprotein [Marinobacter zhejiangensis]|uniref:Phospholipid-binding lipoprotein MlaA n=1 Tax=Marinobacter zhejiangensis TaxID=488535 RepID=A0A1I4RRK2_9GAMM|nr:VacJ family lipoprotein [Marinobacter zhejiangensis]SFM54794.1 phospholipid-binding lipoprotein MlaA [Marinobacter zhejiangensis]